MSLYPVLSSLYWMQLILCCSHIVISWANVAIPCAFIIILDAVDIMLFTYRYIMENVAIPCAFIILLDAVDIMLCIHILIS